MVRVISAGTDQAIKGPHGDDWYKTTNISCPHCGCVFRLDEYDFEVNGPFVGTDLVQHYHWDKTDKFFNPVATTSLYPDGIQGNCPWCDWYPIQVLSVDAGLSHPASVGDPTLNTIQSVIAAGVNQVTFFYTNAQILYGIYLSNGVPYNYNDTAHTSTGIVRTSPSTYNVGVTFQHAQPGTAISPARARQLDSAMVSYLTGFGLAIV